MRVSPLGRSPVRIPPRAAPRKKRPPIGTIIFLLLLAVGGYLFWRTGTFDSLNAALKPKPTPTHPAGRSGAPRAAPQATPTVGVAPAPTPAQPTQPAQPQPQTVDPDSTYVYGDSDIPTMYHASAKCPRMKGTALEITLAMARKQRLQPCPQCRPPR